MTLDFRKRSHSQSPPGLQFESLETRQMLTSNWGLDAVDAPEVWARGITGQGVVVAVIDAGLDLHSDLNANLWTNDDEWLNAADDDGNGYVDDFNGWDFTDDDNAPLTKNKHGNHVLGVIAARNNGYGATGVAFDAKLMPLRIINHAGSSSSRHIADAILFAVDNGADIVNLSIDGIATSNVNAAIQYAANHNVLIVAAAGNSAATEPSFPAAASRDYPNVISVGAHDDQFRRWASTNSAGRNGVIQVDAPGVNVYSTSIDGGYGFSSGTSSAAAHVAGVAALVKSAKPDISAWHLRSAILRGATQQVLGSDSIGAVNAHASVSLVAPAATQATSHPADFNRDGEINFGDFLALSRHFGESGVSPAQGDTDHNGLVDFRDFLTFSPFVW